MDTQVERKILVYRGWGNHDMLITVPEDAFLTFGALDKTDHNPTYVIKAYPRAGDSEPLFVIPAEGYRRVELDVQVRTDSRRRREDPFDDYNTYSLETLRPAESKPVPAWEAESLPDAA